MERPVYDQEQMARLSELDDAALEYLRVLTNAPDLERNGEHIEELNTEAAALMSAKGFKIYYPGIETAEDGFKRVVDIYEDKTPTYNRLVSLILRDADPDCPLGKLTVIGIRTSLSDDELLAAIKAASQEYLETPEGRWTWEYNCHNFNYGDFDLNVPNKICRKHGFMKLDSSPDLLDLDFNEQLAGLPDDGEIK